MPAFRSIREARKEMEILWNKLFPDLKRRFVNPAG